MKGYLIAGIILWILANSFGMNLGLEYILSLPAFFILLFLIALFAL